MTSVLSGRRRILGILGGVLLGVFLVVGLTVGFPTGGSDATPSPQRSPGAQVEEPSDGEDVAARLAELPEDPARFVAPAARELVAGGAAAALPDGARLTADPDTWVPDRAGGGVIRARVESPGQDPQDYLLVVELDDDGRPLVLSTFPAAPPAEQ